MVLFTKTNQEHLGCSPAERGQSRGILLGNRNFGGYRKSLPWRLRWQPGRRYHVVGREGAGVGRVDEDIIWGGNPQSAYAVL